MELLAWWLLVEEEECYWCINYFSIVVTVVTEGIKWDNYYIIIVDTVIGVHIDCTTTIKDIDYCIVAAVGDSILIVEIVITTSIGFIATIREVRFV